MRSLEPVLAELSFSRGLDQRHLALLTGCASNVRVKPGEYLITEGTEAKNFYIVRRGAVAIEIAVPGRGAITVQTLREGDILGWSWLIPPYNWRFDARATELTRAIALDGECLRAKCDEDHGLGYEILVRLTQVMAGRLEAARLQLLDMYSAGR